MNAVLGDAIEAVRHRNIQKRGDRWQPMVPKLTQSDGADWEPCAYCRDEADLLMAELAQRGVTLIRGA